MHRKRFTQSRLLRVFLSITPLTAAAEPPQPESGQQVKFHLQFFKVDAKTESAIGGYLAPAPQSDVMPLLALRPGVDLSELIRSASATGGLQILAAPSMLAAAGHQASFVTGCEGFAIRFGLLPVISTSGTIGLTVTSEVIVAGKSSQKVTTLELAGGQSFVIEGRISPEAREALSKISSTGRGPILQALVDAKLLVLVSAQIVER
jgi:Flp pilus assembly secretin CpaC